MQLKPISPRLLTITYTAALLIIGGLSIGSHVLLDVALRSDEGSAALINQTGRQRMLSQRVAALAAQYRLGDAGARADLLAAIDRLETNHNVLVRLSRDNTADLGARAGEADAETSAGQLRTIYFDGDGPLDEQVKSFVATARQVAALPPDDPGLQPILARLFGAARAPLLVALDNVVSIHQHESERRIRRLENLQWAILVVVLGTLIIEAIMIFRPMIRRITVYTTELLQLATTDALTGADNRRCFLERGELEAVRARRYGHPLSLLLLDVDRFKGVNDTYGHAAGDAVLRTVGSVFRECLRPTDIWGRLGGEEFAILLPETALPEAANVAERLRGRFAGTTVLYGDHYIEFTVSVGVTPLFPGTGDLTNALRAADSLMYRAKQNGRNRIVIDASTPASA